MIKQTKEKKKRRRLKIVFIITAICTIFSLFTISCFAYQTAVVYSPNVYSGTNSYVLYPIERITYVTRTSTRFYLKDIPISDSITAYNSPGWTEHGQPLAMNAQSQVTYGNEVYTGVVNPITITSGVNWDVQALGKDYTNYFNGGVIDAMRYQIFPNTQYGSRSDCYQRAIIDFSDVYVPNPITNEAVAHVINPQLRMYRPVTYGNGYYSFRCTISGRSNLDGKFYTQNIALNDVSTTSPSATVEYNGIMQNIYAVNVLTKLARTADSEFESCDYWHITNLTVVLGNQQFNLDSMGVNVSGCSGIDLYFPSLRPFDASKIDTLEEAFDVKSPVNYDVNFNRNYEGERDLAGDTSSSLKISSVGAFIGDITRGFLDVYIIPGISLGGILFTCLAIGFIVVVLRYFAGG